MADILEVNQSALERRWMRGRKWVSVWEGERSVQILFRDSTAWYKRKGGKRRC